MTREIDHMEDEIAIIKDETSDDITKIKEKKGKLSPKPDTDKDLVFELNDGIIELTNLMLGMYKSVETRCSVGHLV